MVQNIGKNTWLKVPVSLYSSNKVLGIRTDLLRSGNECPTWLGTGGSLEFLCTSTGNVGYTCSCPPGRMLVNNQCVTCGGAGTFSACRKRCFACPEGTWSPPFSYCPEHCESLPGTVGDYDEVADTTICAKCPASQYADTVSNTCKACPAASWSPPGSDSTNDCVCAANSFISTTGGTVSTTGAAPGGTPEEPCVACPEGSTLTGSGIGITSCRCDQNTVKVRLAWLVMFCR